MEEEGIGLVLARATELRLKISNCIHKATANGPSSHAADDDDEEATERLLNICDALEALETQLSSLQVPFSKLGIFFIWVFFFYDWELWNVVDCLCFFKRFLVGFLICCCLSE